MKSLEEVKEHFKNAKVVRCLTDNKLVDLSTVEKRRDVHKCNNGYWIDYENCDGYRRGLKLYKLNVLAEIVEYKDKVNIANMPLIEALDNHYEVFCDYMMKMMAKQDDMKKPELQKAKEMHSQGGAAKEFILTVYSEEELTEKKVEKYSDLEIIKGWYIDDFDCDILYEGNLHSKKEGSKCVFTTEALAKSSLAKAQLSQLMKQFNGDWVADWGNPEQVKRTIHRHGNMCCRSKECNTYHFLSFDSDKKSNEFHELHEDLICEYLMID